MTAIAPPPEQASPSKRAPRAAATLDSAALEGRLDGILARHAAVGLAVAVIRQGFAPVFASRGLASIEPATPVSPDTVFRIGSVTKLFTAVAVMQLADRGLVDLDAPASSLLRTYRLEPAEPAWRPTTIRHLLTHTSGIPEVISVRDVLHPSWGGFWSRPAIASVALGDPMPSLAAYYRGRLRVVVEPGRFFAYSGHGFATLGQVIEDVTGQPLERYFREQLFEPLGMADADLARLERVRSRLATGYRLRPRGLEAVTDREWLGGAGGGIYATTRDLARFAAALLGGGEVDGRRIISATTLATMFEPHFRPHPALAGMGLGFFRGEVGGHRVVRHEGLLPGFVSDIVVAPDDGLAIIALTNIDGASYTWLPIEVDRILRSLLGLPEKERRLPLPQHPERWPELCGTYILPPRISDLRGRLALRGADVTVRGDRLVVRLRTLVPGLSREFPVLPDDATDPDVFRIDLASVGLPSARVAFARDHARQVAAVHTDLNMQTLVRRPPTTGPNVWLLGALATAGLAGAARMTRGRRHERTAP
jgi:CubicO group peptidase (beta-lactamase class C family)